MKLEPNNDNCLNASRAFVGCSFIKLIKSPVFFEEKYPKLIVEYSENNRILISFNNCPIKYAVKPNDKNVINPFKTNATEIIINIDTNDSDNPSELMIL